MIVIVFYVNSIGEVVSGIVWIIVLEGLELII